MSATVLLNPNLLAFYGGLVIAALGWCVRLQMAIQKLQIAQGQAKEDRTEDVARISTLEKETQGTRETVIEVRSDVKHVLELLQDMRASGK